MSNGDDVLDNWEELDEVGLNSTLQKIQAERINTKPLISDENIINITPKTIITAIDTDIETADNNFYTSGGALLSNTTTVTTYSYTPTTMKILQRTQPQQELNSKLLSTTTANAAGGTAINAADVVVSSTDTTTNDLSEAIGKSPLDTMAATFEPVMMVLHKQEDEYQAANYELPINNQTVKILRRPTQNMDMRNNGLKQPKQPIKTLQQREQEYAEARLRIMGAAKNPDDETALAENATAVTTTGDALNSRTSTSSLTATTTAPTTSLSSTKIGRTLTTNYQNNMTTATPTPTTTPTQQFVATTTNAFTQIVTHPYTPKMHTNVGNFNLNPSPKISQSGLNLYNNYYYAQQLQQQQQQQTLQQTTPQQQFYYQHAHQQQQPPPQQQQQQQQASAVVVTTPAVFNNRTQNLLPMVYQSQLHGGGTPTSQPTHMTWSPIVGGSVSTSSLRHQHPDSILRTPRGPDGSHGFQMRR